MAYLGVQDATRKGRQITQTSGEWIISVPESGVLVTVSQQKWDRDRTSIKKWDDVLRGSTDRPWLKIDIGFLVHLSVSFLRGFYLTLNSWRKGRDKDCWKIPERAYKLFLELGRRGSINDEVIQST